MMDVNFGTLVGIAALAGFFISGGFYQTTALICYECNGSEACTKDKLGKSGSCHATESEIKGSEYCLTMVAENGVISRKCGAFPKNANGPTKQPEDTHCHHYHTNNWNKELYLLPCLCFTDFCNGDPATCCGHQNGASEEQI